MTEHVRHDLLVALRQRLAAKGVTTDTDFSAYPVGLPHQDIVPIVGNVHIPAGRVAKRKDVDNRFSKLKF